GRGLVVPGGEDGGAEAGEAGQVAGPAVDVARVGDDHQEGGRRLQGQGGGGQAGRRAPRPVHGRAAPLAEGLGQGPEALRTPDQRGKVLQVCGRGQGRVRHGKSSLPIIGEEGLTTANAKGHEKGGGRGAHATR